MAKVTATDADGNNVEVYEARFNNLGGIESILVKVDGRMGWRHAHEFNVEVDKDAEHIGPADNGVMTKNTMLDQGDTRTKQVTPPAADEQVDGQPLEPTEPTEPTEPVDPDNTPADDGNDQSNPPAGDDNDGDGQPDEPVE